MQYGGAPVGVGPPPPPHVPLRLQVLPQQSVSLMQGLTGTHVGMGVGVDEQQLAS
jgi:hypothetical protein